jgi:serine/threonine protein kinase
MSEDAPDIPSADAGTRLRSSGTRLRSETPAADSLPPAFDTAPAEVTSEWIGRVLQDQYRLEDRLGGGGMGDVYLARDLLAEANQDPDPFVAVKVLSAALRGDTEATRGLQREARRAQQLSHENIVRVHYFGRDGDTYYLTMELLRGDSFEHLIRQYSSGIGVNEAMPLIDGLCRGLAYAHKEGIVHSDVKPNNVFLTQTNVVKVLDFGIAMPLRRSGTAGTETRYNPRRLGALTPGYSAVELYLGLDPDPRDDIFSAGCVIYELLSGRHPYERLEAPQALEQKKTPTAIRGLTRQQNQALQKALALRREERTTSIDEFLAAFSTADVQRPRLAMWGSIAAAVLVAAVGTVWFITRSPGNPPGKNERLGTSSSPAIPPPARTHYDVPPPDSGPAPDTAAPERASANPSEPSLPAESGALPPVSASTGSSSPAENAGSDTATSKQCDQLDEHWDRLSCESRRACFVQRATDARFASMIAAPDLKPMYEAREQMYGLLQKAACADQITTRTREYETFQQKFPGYSAH